jgi:Zn-dependent peptidase ImmA (M78 family)
MEAGGSLRKSGALTTMNEFCVTPARKQRIAGAFHTEPKNVDLLEKVFNSLDIKNQYLAHVIRAMESYICSATDNQLFRIICKPSLGDLEIGSAQYFHKKFFIVHFNPKMREKDLRVYLAHELGHLFLLAVVNNGTAARKRLSDDMDTEPLSSIFGVFTMASKNHFYRNVKDNTQLNHTTWEEMEEAFLTLKGKRARVKRTV